MTDALAAADERWMRAAIEQAGRAFNTTHPNPRVGCVLVRGGELVGAGYHSKVGGPHAEIAALASAGERARGADCYVTLEPCAHHGRTPPCADALIEAGVRRVVAAVTDPDPRVAGRGLARLRDAGIATSAGLLQAAARAASPGFFSALERGRPWVRLKLAISLDGRIAHSSGRSQWITGSAARLSGHRWRARADLIMTGGATLRADNPSLTVREVDGDYIQPQPLVITHSAKSIPADSRLAQDERDLRIVAGAGATVALEPLMEELAAEGFREIHVEAGGRLAGALMRAGLVDELLLYQAPVLLGEHGVPMIVFGEESELDDAPRFVEIERERLGDDWFVRYQRRGD